MEWIAICCPFFLSDYFDIRNIFIIFVVEIKT